MSSDARDGSESPEPGTEQDSSIMAEEKNDRASTEEKSPDRASNGKKSTSKANAKDPSRPKRKKARRACFACQRAHLTCSDERPCDRCVKRGLGDQCQDGVRKKAKYLHDTPAEALMPGFNGNYDANGSQSMPPVPTGAAAGLNGMSVSQPGNYFPDASNNYPMYSPRSQQTQMPAPMMDGTNILGDMNGQQIASPTQFQPSSSQQVSPMQDLTNTMDQSSGLGSTGNSFDASFMDPNDPSLYNFNISDFNFGNHYGALEFGMLGQMSSGAVNTPDVEVMGSIGQPQSASLSYDSAGFPSSSIPYNQGFQPWQSVQNSGSRQGSTANLWPLQNHGTDAIALADTSASFSGASPHSQNQDSYASSSTISPDTPFAQSDQSQQQTDLLRQTLSQAQQQGRKPVIFPNDVGQNGFKRRRRDTSEIYNGVRAPYPYTQAFHGLTEFLQDRFQSQKVLRIAKAMASIRPSFISCNQNLDHEDLIFMEKGFQRACWEYENYIAAIGTPTIAFRRTGEVALANKEFSLVTGWQRDVLLGNAPNLNVNYGSAGSGRQTGSSSRGEATPRNAQVEQNSARPHPVFVAELFDEDSVVQFYEAFAEMAFGASRASIIGEGVSLLKYKTKDDPGWGPEDRFGADGTKKPQDVKQEALMKGEAGMNTLGEKDGKIVCRISWDVKRDIFGIPMLIIMNILPEI